MDHAVIDRLEQVETHRARDEWIELALREVRPKTRAARRRQAKLAKRDAAIAAERAEVHAVYAARAAQIQDAMPAVLEARFGVPVSVTARVAPVPFGVQVTATVGGSSIAIDPGTGAIIPAPGWPEGPVTRPGELARYLRWSVTREHNAVAA